MHKEQTFSKPDDDDVLRLTVADDTFLPMEYLPSLPPCATFSAIFLHPSSYRHCFQLLETFCDLESESFDPILVLDLDFDSDYSYTKICSKKCHTAHVRYRVQVYLLSTGIQYYRTIYSHSALCNAFTV
jgi:hypothetical protein